MRATFNYIITFILLLTGIAGKAQDTVPVPDSSFRQYLVNNHPSVMDSNEQLITSEAANITGALGLSSRNIKDLTGLQYFKNLSELQASNNEISYIPPLDSLSQLIEIELHGNGLDSIPDLSNNTALEELFIDKNNLDSVPGLEHLKNLEHMDISRNNIENLPSLDSLTNLVSFLCYKNNLNALPSLDSLQKLEELYCYDNNLTSFPSVSNLDSLRELSFGENQLESFPDLNNNTQLTMLGGWSNKLRSFPDVNHLNKLRVLNLGNNQLKTLPEVSNLDSLRELYCDNNELEQLPDLSNLQHLKQLICHDNNLKVFPDLSSKSSLDSVSLYNNKLSFDDLIPNTAHPDFASVFDSLEQDDLGQYADVTLEQLDTLKFRLFFDANVTSNTYRWYHEGEAIATTDTNALWVDSLDYEDAGNYYCKITNSTPELQDLTLQTTYKHVEVISCLHTANLKTKIINNCPPSITVEVDTNSIRGGRQPYQFELEKRNGKIIQGTPNRFKNLSTGKYDLYIRDNHGCYITITGAIDIPRRKKNCTNVISPDGDGLNDAYYIEKQGIAKIYNRQGRLIRTINTPAKWDGTTDSGRIAATGQYIIKVNGQVVKVTVVK